MTAMSNPAPVAINRLRHRVEIQVATEAADVLGDMIPTWKTVATRWGSVNPLSGKELFDARKVKSNVTHRVVIRGYTGPGGARLTTSNRLVHKGRTLNIETVSDPQERGILTEVLCTEETQP